MKNCLKLIIAMIFIGFILSGCFWYNQEKDPLVTSLKSFHKYILDKDKKSNGAFFNYIKNNPHYTIVELEEKEFLSRSDRPKQINSIEKEVNSREGEDIWNVARKTLPPEFINLQEGNQASKLCIFCCTGCLNDKKRDHCIRIAVWDMGPGCSKN